MRLLYKSLAGIWLFSYYQSLGVKTTLSACFNADITSLNLDRSKVDFAELDPNDPAIGYGNGELKKLKPKQAPGYDYTGQITLLKMSKGFSSLKNLKNTKKPGNVMT